MARSIDTIENQIIADKEANSNLSELTSSSRTAIWRLWVYIVAAAMNVFEQLQDVYKSEIEDISDKAIPGTRAWAQDRTLRFQYSAANNQVIKLNDNLELVYDEVKEEYQIVTRCSVIEAGNQVVNIKVAKDTSATDTTPIALTTAELNALKDYWGVIGFAGVGYTVTSDNSDKIGVTATVFYQGQYSSSIQTDVELAINNYLASIPFDGRVRVSKIEDAIQSVTGVNDFKIDQITGRADAAVATAFYDLATSVNNVSYSLTSGYCVEETTISKTFADTITYIAQ